MNGWCRPKALSPCFARWRSGYACSDGRTDRFRLGGGGARGIYEAGALSIRMPALERLGQRPSMFVGTSVGAINAAYLAASQHPSAAEATGGLHARVKARLDPIRWHTRCCTNSLAGTAPPTANFSATSSSTTSSWKN
ncbi:patatin-like phospholipase family protein [Saccharopolyspora sp. NPDC000995]